MYYDLNSNQIILVMYFAFCSENSYLVFVSLFLFVHGSKYLLWFSSINTYLVAILFKKHVSKILLTFKDPLFTKGKV